MAVPPVLDLLGVIERGGSVRCGADDEVAVMSAWAQPTITRGIARIAAARILTPWCR
jgi:hypothetical protein